MTHIWSDVTPTNWITASETYYTMWVWHYKNADVPRSDVPPTNQTQCFRALLHHVSLTCGQMHVNPGQMYPPTHQTQGYWPLLHHVSLTFTRIQMYPGKTYPPTQLIEPSASQPYYSMRVWHVQECRWTQVRWTPQSNPVLESHTTPCEFDMWTTAYEPRSHVPPANQTQCYRPQLHHVSLTCRYIHINPGQMYPPIKPSTTESYYTMLVSHVNECICIQVKCTHPLLIKPSATKPYYTITVWHVQECRCTLVRCTCPANCT